MTKLTGIGVSSGIAIGEAVVKQKEKIKIEKEFVSSEERNSEIERFDAVVKLQLTDLESFIDKYSATDEDKELLETHKTILLDPLLSERIIAMIENENYSAENALYKFFLELTNVFAKMANSYLAERISDYEEVIFKLIAQLTGRQINLFDEKISAAGDDSLILIMDNISPSEVTRSYHSNVEGICLEKGSKTSHSSIIARALGIPVVVGIPDVVNRVSESDTLIIDGKKGLLIIDPDQQTLREYRELYEKDKETRKELSGLSDLPCRTKDGKEIPLFNNIELEQEIDTVITNRSAGIGLYRTEFLFVNREEQPSEEEQFSLYKRLAEKLQDKKLIIRTYDLGGDKISKLVSVPEERNPYLGCRGIRLSLRFPEIFKKQVRAILRASAYGNVAIMFPMIASAQDLSKALEIVALCKKELDEENIGYNRKMETGVMIEVPAAALCAEELAGKCDFFSIGTNDLVQYTMAADRNSEEVAAYYDPYNPAVFKLIAMTVDAAHNKGKHVSVCGEIASETDFISLFIAMDIDSLSVNPASHLRVKKQIMDYEYKRNKKLMESIHRINNPQELKRLINKINKANN
jgi:phosphotransferase system enzyme I (PtsI)